MARRTKRTRRLVSAGGDRQRIDAERIPALYVGAIRFASLTRIADTIFSKRKPHAARRGGGYQGAVFLRPERAPDARVWFGVREPLCSLELKNAGEADEFGLAMLIAYVVDLLLDSAVVPVSAFFFSRVSESIDCLSEQTDE